MVGLTKRTLCCADLTSCEKMERLEWKHLSNRFFWFIDSLVDGSLYAKYGSIEEFFVS